MKLKLLSYILRDKIINEELPTINHLIQAGGIDLFKCFSFLRMQLAALSNAKNRMT